MRSRLAAVWSCRGNNILKIRVNDLTLDESTHSDCTIDIFDNGKKILFKINADIKEVMSQCEKVRKRKKLNRLHALIAQTFTRVKISSIYQIA